MAPKRKKQPIEAFIEKGRDLDWDSPDDIRAKDLRAAYNNLLARTQPCPYLHDDPVSAVQGGSNGKDGQTSNATPAKPKSAGQSSKCTATLCADKAECLNWLGQELWEDEAKGFKLFGKRHGLHYDPHEQARDWDVPVGLKVRFKNLGSTCYISSYLQTWFQNRTFRDGVFKCALPSSSSVKLEDMPLFQLQVAFAAMQNGPTSVFNPSPLVKSLKIPEAEQQDATEFGKLFMGLLDLQFKKQADPSVKSLITDMFEGKLSYNTKCKACKYISERTENFLELDITIKPKCNLVDQIELLLQKETMCGDNKYSCSGCSKMVDAVRYIKLKELPPILHFSLMRFGFDAKTMDRKKSNSFIEYPKTLDMSDYVEGGASLVYELKGVLLHKGSSAHHGHYVAQVWDEQKKQWFLCDDESVEVIENKPAKKADKPGKVKLGSNGKQVIDLCSDSDGEAPPPTAQDEGTSKSKDAYLLVYVLRNAAAPQSAPDQVPISAPLQARLDAISAEWEKECKEYDGKLAAARIAFEEERQRKRAIYSALPPQDDLDINWLVDRDVLKKIIQGTLAPKDKKKAAGPADETKSIESKVSSDAARQETKSVDADKTIPNGAGTNGKLTNGSTHTPDANGVVPNGDAATAEHEPMNGKSGSSSPGLDKAASVFAISKKMDNSHIACVHGALDPLKLSQVKIISSLAMAVIQEQGHLIAPAISSEEAYCRQCLWSRFSAKHYLTQHQRDIQAYRNAAATDLGGSSMWISRAWLEDWQKSMPKMHNKESGLDVSPGAQPYRSHVFCEHGELDAKLNDRKSIGCGGYQYLRTLFPKWTSLPTSQPRCPECTRHMPKLTEDEINDLSEREKKHLRVFKDGPRILQGPAQVTSSFAPNLYLAPREWMQQWRTWIRAPHDVDRPDTMQFDNYLCKHGLVCCNVLENDSSLTVITAQEWHFLAEAYQIRQSIQFTPADGRGPYTTNPPLCQPCLDERALDYEEATITLVILTKADFDKSGTKKPFKDMDLGGGANNDESPSGVFYGDSKERSDSPPGLRRSTRVGRGERQTQLSFGPAARKRHRLEISPEQTVKEIQILIGTDRKIPTIYQRLWLRDKELDDGSATMRQLGVRQGDVLQVVNVRHDQDDDDIDLSKLETPRKKRKHNDSEGFQSTGLYGYDTGESEASEMDVDIPADLLAEAAFQDQGAFKNCSACTFLNPWTATRCEICDAHV